MGKFPERRKIRESIVRGQTQRVIFAFAIETASVVSSVKLTGGVASRRNSLSAH